MFHVDHKLLSKQTSNLKTKFNQDTYTISLLAIFYSPFIGYIVSWWNGLLNANGNC